jgi:hypothetical protein
VNGELIGLRHICRDEAGAAVLKLGQECEVPAEPVELGHDERGTGELASGERLLELRAIVRLSGLDLHELSEKLP